MRFRRNSIAANPILIGAVTVLVTVIAVFLAYNANNGLPFVPTYDLTAQLPDGESLVKGDDVRIGGDRVGFISDITPVAHKNGTVSAKLTLKLDKNAQPLPNDSTLMVRPRSAIGLKYLQITRGHSRTGFKSGATIPLKQATPQPVEIDQIFNMFDKRTRDAQKVDLREFGNALVGRGSDLNAAISDFDPLVRNLVPVMTNLADPDTALGNFFDALERTASIVVPVAETQASLFDNLATTFDAFANIARPYLQDTISGGPEALDTAIHAFPIQRPFIDNSAAFFHDLQPGAVALKQSGAELAEAFTAGVKTLPGAPALNKRVTDDVFTTLQNFAEDPQVTLGLNGLTGTAQALAPTVAHLGGAQVNCNYLAVLLNNAASAFSGGNLDHTATWLQAASVAPPLGPNSEGGASSAPANGPILVIRNDPTAKPTANHLHANPYPSVGAFGGPRACVAGNEGYVDGRTVIGNPPGVTAKRTTSVSKNLNG